MIRIRKASRLDTPDMARLLTAIIAQGGTTALTKPVESSDLADWMAQAPAVSAWHVAEAEGTIVGFQWIGPSGDLGPKVCEIATFVEVGRTGLGIGSALFTATAQAAKALGYNWIDATIRADNEGGLIYYQSRGFRDWDHLYGVRLENGLIVDKVRKRYDL